MVRASETDSSDQPAPAGGLYGNKSSQLPVLSWQSTVHTWDLYRKVLDRKRFKPEGPIIGLITTFMLGGIRICIVFVRDQCDPDKWLALASSDMDINPERICGINAKRWAIDVFFKQIKPAGAGRSVAGD
jgi:hypothetical protein